jgi:dipeptide/tripeptide permease
MDAAAVGFLERIGFNGVQGNLVMYLTGPMAMSTAAAAAGANAWGGTVLVLTLAADSRLGRYRAIVAAGVLHLLVSSIFRFSRSIPVEQLCHRMIEFIDVPTKSRNFTEFGNADDLISDATKSSSPGELP